MKRRSFLKKSASAAALTPLAFSGLINAAGADGGGGTSTTTAPETTGTTIATTIPVCTLEVIEEFHLVENGKDKCFFVVDCDPDPLSEDKWRTEAAVCGQNELARCRALPTYEENPLIQLSVCTS